MGGGGEGGEDGGDGGEVKVAGPALGNGLLVEAGKGEAAVTGGLVVRVCSWLREGAGWASSGGGVHGEGGCSSEV